MFMLLRALVIMVALAVGYVIHREVLFLRPYLSAKDCAGAILYSTERAIEVAMEGQQCLGGNGYINGLSYLVQGTY